MGEDSRIGWCRHTLNFWWGCNKVSTECRHCYIGPIMRRGGREPFNGPVRTSPATWRRAFKWNTEAPGRVFTCSMSDFFHTAADPWREEAWNVIRECDNLTWLILTKRIRQAASRLPHDWGEGWPHVWLGVTCGAKRSMWRIDQLATLPAAVRWVSAEPLVEAVELRDRVQTLDWVVAGFESGAKDRRVGRVEWIESLSKECQAAGVALYVKQGNHHLDGQQGDIPDRLWRVKEFPDARRALPPR